MIEAELPDGTVLEFPEGTSQDVVQRAVRQRLNVAASPSQTRRERRDSSFTDSLRDVAAGALRGAGSIGATFLSPIDAAARALNNGKPVNVDLPFIGPTDIAGHDRRAGMDQFMRDQGVDTDSLSYKGGKIGTEIAGTAGVGGFLAKGAQALGAAPQLVQAIRTAGLANPGTSSALGNLGIRTAGGAITGGASAGLVDPEDAKLGALVGGALPLATQAIKGGIAAGRHMVGGTTGAGDKALQTAYEAGKAGGAQGQAFRDNMRGKVDLTDVLDDAKANLRTMQDKASAAYRQNMAQVSGDKTVLDLAPIDNAIQDSINKFTFKGQAKNPEALAALQKVQAQVNAWKKLNPAEYHTPEGLDALKQQIGATLESIPMESRDVRKAVSGVYNSVKNSIQGQAPVYAKTMKDYSEAAELISEIEKSLIGGKRASADTSMRKLQSVMRNNVNTNYGARTAAAEALEQQGGRQIMPQLAGQALNDWMPRGIQRATGPGLSLGAGALGGIPAAAGAAAMSSPRLMGEAAYLAGRADPIIQALRRQIYLGAPVIAAQD